jgi:hypothetical protein
MLAALCAFVLLVGVAAAETGYATRDLELRAEPKSDSAAVGSLAKGGRYELIRQHQAWSEVNAGGKKGWVLSLFLMAGDPPQERSVGRTLSDLVSLGTERAGKGQMTSTIGVRGLDEDELKSARPNAEELRKLESYAVPPEAGEALARQGQLGRRSLAYPEAPSSGAPSTMGSTN